MLYYEGYIRCQEKNHILDGLCLICLYKQILKLVRNYLYKHWSFCIVDHIYI